MPQMQSVSKLVYRFFEKSLSHQSRVIWQAVELLSQPKARDDGARSAHLRLAEYVLENRDIEINVGHCKDPPILRPDQSLHMMEDLRRMKLLPLGVIRGRRIERYR